jgi:hypothetical protein
MGLMPTLKILYRFKNPWKIVRNLYGSNTSYFEKYLSNLKFELFNLNKDLEGICPLTGTKRVSWLQVYSCQSG